MKKIVGLLAFVAASLAFTACEPAGDGTTIYPSFEQVTFEQRDGELFGRFDITCDTDYALREVTVSYTYGSQTIQLPESELEITEAHSYEWTVRFYVPVDVEGTPVESVTLSATVRGNNGGTKSQTFAAPSTTPEEPSATELGEAVGFTFSRVGGAEATGLDMFGLAWNQNRLSATNVEIVKDGAAKFVELSAGDWTNIATVEALAEAIDAAADMDSYLGISADSSSSYDVVLGVLNGDTYYMLHITSATVTADSVTGTTIEITGDYKN